MTAREYAIQCIRDEAEAVRSLADKIDESFDKAVNTILACKGKVIVTGVGKSGHIGAKIAATLSSTGTPSFFINPLDVFHGDLGVMTPEDVVLAISNSGQTDELLRFIPMLLHMNIPIIGMSGHPNSLLAKYSTCFLNVGVDKEACPLNLAPTSSTMAQLAMGDALAIALMKARHFKSKDFAQFHPGGELGKRLLTTASDIMRTENIPFISPDMHLGDAIMEVSKGQLGLGIAEVGGRMVGLITNGDIRRAMERWQADFFNHVVSDIMTTHPQTVKPETKVSEVQKIIKKHKVHSVPVVDENNCVLGIIDQYLSLI
ncbi:MAG: KpsF/GutQ family sugar-phosphate isomerase [Prevotella sp.]|nr:KpsF/GutQ family sugar-phosphate isomerase [Prevotella sp.]